VSNPQRFADGCLPRFFKHNKLGSFQQQLLTYGFVRVPNSSCLDAAMVWRHPSFLKGRPELLESIHRATKLSSIDESRSKLAAAGGSGNAGSATGSSGVKRTAPDEAAAGKEEPDSPPEEELGRMQTHLGQLRSHLHLLHGELRTARSVEMNAIDSLMHLVNKRLRSDSAVVPANLEGSPAEESPADSAKAPPEAGAGASQECSPQANAVAPGVASTEAHEG